MANATMYDPKNAGVTTLYVTNDAKGVDGQMLQGKAPKNEGDTFKSQAQVVKAMSDPQYEKDPAYRQAIYDKLERSNLQF